MNTELMFSSLTPEHATPQAFFDTLHREFHFDLDPASTVANAKCPRYFTEDVDGLAQKWAGRVYCNPPYGREIGKWIEKGWRSVVEGDAEVVVMLLPSRTDTAWFHTFCVGAEIRFIEGRLKFGGAKNCAPFPSMVVVFRPDAKGWSHV